MFVFIHICAFLKKFLEKFACFQTDKRLTDNKTRIGEWSYDEYINF